MNEVHNQFNKRLTMNFNNFFLKIFLLFCFFSNLEELHAQVGIGTSAPLANAILDLDSTTQGFLPPRMTQAQMSAIASPVAGLVLYCTDCSPSSGPVHYNGVNYEYFDGTIPSSLTTLDCSSSVHTGALYQLSPVSGTASSSIPYTVTAGGRFIGGATFSSTGVLGLTGTVGSLVAADNSSGNFTFFISGTPQTTGIASFPISIGGLSCILNRVVLPAPDVGSLNCAAAMDTSRTRLWTGYDRTLNLDIPYTSGNGEAYPLPNRATFPSTGVTGLTATILPGTLTNGSGNIQVSITGTPSGPGTASFNIDFGNQSCVLQRSVTNPMIVNGVAFHRIIQGSQIDSGSNNPTLTQAIASHGISVSDLIDTSDLAIIRNANSKFSDLATALGISLQGGTVLTSVNYDYFVGNGALYNQRTSNRAIFAMNYSANINFVGNATRHYYILLSKY